MGPGWKGRGSIQIRGAHYLTYGDRLGRDLIAYPDPTAHPNVGFRSADLFWSKRGLSTLANTEFKQKSLPKPFNEIQNATVEYLHPKRGAFDGKRWSVHRGREVVTRTSKARSVWVWTDTRVGGCDCITPTCSRCE
jgi:hypothetical protein